ncbi:hypothetical protein GE061_017118 [Apolygus lucorum]|uniref:Malate dehydrogenase, mitochondrial n=1 Tax=Apolygus lucorum TaxID=248454 RepID=A0A6A4K4X7_APOLU|nr:hypothetical protein GE061_017118 [Apolygus lucorum]
MLTKWRTCRATLNLFSRFVSDKSASSRNEPCEEKCPEKKVDPIAYKPPKSVKVTVINSASDVGKITNLVLKQDPLIKELRMYCLGATIGMATDLKSVPTSTKGFAFTGKNLHIALKKSDIVFLVGSNELDDVMTDAEVFEKNKGYIKNIATSVAKNCPEAIVGISVYPINSTVPLFAEIMRQHGVFCPNRILGCMSLYTMRARSVTACILGVNPTTVKVDVLGGGTPNTIVPLIGSATPGGHCLAGRADEISLGIANMNSAVWALNKHQAMLSAAHANAAFVHDLAKGLTGKPSEGIAFLRNTGLYGLKYSALPVEYGLNGVSKIHRIPKMSKNEISRFDQAIPFLQDDIENGEKAANAMITPNVEATARCERAVKVCCTT